MRLDNYLVENSFFESRNRAQEAIKNGLVKVDNKIIKKPSFKINSQKIDLLKDKFYVSRAGKKLESYLQEYTLPIKDSRCLDIGSSTGGFTQILLENSALSVDCVDVGKEQLHHSLRENDRVNVYEECDIREFKSKPYDLIVSDVSFISLLLIVDSINRLSRDGTVITLLFKPQFEVGINVKRNSKGVVQDIKAIQKAKELFLAKTKELGWIVLDNRKSRISGKEGNIEEFFTFKK